MIKLIIDALRFATTDIGAACSCDASNTPTITTPSTIWETVDVHNLGSNYYRKLPPLMLLSTTRPTHKSKSKLVARQSGLNNLWRATSTIAAVIVSAARGPWASIIAGICVLCWMLEGLSVLFVWWLQRVVGWEKVLDLVRRIRPGRLVGGLSSFQYRPYLLSGLFQCTVFRCGFKLHLPYPCSAIQASKMWKLRSAEISKFPIDLLRLYS